MADKKYEKITWRGRGDMVLAVERHLQIVNIVNERKSVRVTELSKLFSVTEETIRRDLEKLENEKKLSRSHGGAISINAVSPPIEIPYFEREVINIKEKKEIAEEAVKYVNAEDQIILDASSTAWYMAKILPDIPLTVLTNSIKVAIELAAKDKIEVIAIGGLLLSKSLSFTGPMAESTFENYHVNKAFISCKGFHFEGGLSESNEPQARIKEKMMKIADTVYMMIDHSKFHVQAFAKMGGLEHINQVIVDSNVDGETINQLLDLRLKVIKV